MELKGRRILVLGGAGLVGTAVARRVLAAEPSHLRIASLRKAETDEALEELREAVTGADTRIDGYFGDLFVPDDLRARSREEIRNDAAARARLVDDLYGALTQDVLERSALGRLLLDFRPDVVVDCINTAGALAYRDAFRSASTLRSAAARGSADTAAVEEHLSTLYLPQLIRHVQVALEAMKQVGTGMYVKVGTAGTGGMGLNIPFTHSEERPSRVLLAKSSLAGAHTLLLYLMARTPGAPSVKEVKPTAAISWKSIAYGPVRRGGRPLTRSDAVGPLPLEEAFREDAPFRALDETLDGVVLDAGENGLFSPAEFETG